MHVPFLAHLSRRLRGELIVYRSSRRPSVRACVCVHTFKHEYLLDLWVDHNQILSEASLGWGIGCIRFLGQIGSELWFPWQQKAPIGLQWRKRCLHFFSAVNHPILFILAGNDHMHESSDEFEFRPARITGCGVSCP